MRGMRAFFFFGIMAAAAGVGCALLKQASTETNNDCKEADAGFVGATAGGLLDVVTQAIAAGHAPTSTDFAGDLAPLVARLGAPAWCNLYSFASHLIEDWKNAETAAIAPVIGKKPCPFKHAVKPEYEPYLRQVQKLALQRIKAPPAAR